jgi:hypothetical protein
MVSVLSKIKRPRQVESKPIEATIDSVIHAIPDAGSLDELINDLYYCCNVVIDQQKKMDQDMVKLKKFTQSLHDFITDLGRRVTSLTSTNDQMDAKLITNTERLDIVEKAISVLGTEKASGFDKVNNELQNIRTDIDSLVDKVASIKLSK